MSPILDMAGFLAVRGIRDALRGTSARVVALSPIGLDGHRPAGVDAATFDRLVRPEKMIGPGLDG